MPEVPVKYVLWVWDKGPLAAAGKISSTEKPLTYLDTATLEEMRLAAEDVAQRVRDELDTRYDRTK